MAVCTRFVRLLAMAGVVALCAAILQVPGCGKKELTGAQKERADMVEALKRCRLLTDQRLAAAVLKVPREQLLPPGFAQYAYSDVPLTLGPSSFEPSPLVQIAMVQAGRVGPRLRVLDVEPGMGYRAALCAALGAHVYCVVGSPAHKQTLEGNMDSLGFGDAVTVELGQRDTGLPQYGAYNVVFGSWQERAVPDIIKQQLRNQARVVLLPSRGQGRIVVLKCQKGTLERTETLDLGKLSQTYQRVISVLQKQ